MNNEFYAKYDIRYSSFKRGSCSLHNHFLCSTLKKHFLATRPDTRYAYRIKSRFRLKSFRLCMEQTTSHHTTCSFIVFRNTWADVFNLPLSYIHTIWGIFVFYVDLYPFLLAWNVKYREISAMKCDAIDIFMGFLFFTSDNEIEVRFERMNSTKKLLSVWAMS